jgi:acetylornithine aminotransferase
VSHLFWYPGQELLLGEIVRAENCHLYDAQGRRYVDLESGVWCTSVGHGHRRIAHVMEEQASRIGHGGFCYTHPVVEEAAGEILSLLGFVGGRCVFLCSGSEAVEYAVRLARIVAERPLLLTLADSYFGAYGKAYEKDPASWFQFDWFDCANCPVSLSCDRSCERLASIPLDRVGAFLFEPGSSSGLVRFPPEKLIRRICEEVRTAGGLVLVNGPASGSATSTMGSLPMSWRWERGSATATR